MADGRKDRLDDPAFPDGQTASEYLAQVGGLPDQQIDLTRAALALAGLDRPRVSLERYLHHVDRLVSECRDIVAGEGATGLPERVSAINTVLYERYEYDGDTLSYDDLQNANLMRVIDRRKGLPITLSILYLHVARALGWPAEGVNFPGHFLVRMREAAEVMMIDPFRQGREITTAGMRDLVKHFKGGDAELSPEDYAGASNRDILMRLLNNQKLRLLQASDFTTALDVAERTVLVAPADAGAWHDAGVINAQIGNLQRGLECLDRVLELSTDDILRMQVAQLLQELRGKLN